MEAAGPSRILVLRAQAHGRAATLAIIPMRLAAGRLWPLHTLPARWRCCGQLFLACGIRLLRVVMPWITRLFILPRHSAVPLVRQTTSMVGAGSIFLQL